VCVFLLSIRYGHSVKNGFGEWTTAAKSTKGHYVCVLKRIYTSGWLAGPVFEGACIKSSRAANKETTFFLHATNPSFHYVQHPKAAALDQREKDVNDVGRST